MKRIFSFALGFLTEKINSSECKTFLDYLRKLGIQGIEITFGPKERLYSFKLDKDLKSRLKKFRYITIHAPFELVKDSKDRREIVRQLDIIDKLYAEIKAKRVIIHPDNLPKAEILKKYGFKVSTENLKRKRDISIPKLRKIIKRYPKIGFCLDTSHAFSWSQHETGKLATAFKDRITQIHLSARHGGKDHQFLSKADRQFLSSIEPIKKINVPIVIEEEIKKINLNSIKKEIEYIKKFFAG